MPEQTSIGFTVSFLDPSGTFSNEEAFHTNKNNNWKGKYNRLHEKYTNAAGNYFKVSDTLYEQFHTTGEAYYRLIKAPAYGLHIYGGSTKQAYTLDNDDFRTSQFAGEGGGYSEDFRRQATFYPYVDDTLDLWRIEYVVPETPSGFKPYDSASYTHSFWPGLGEYGVQFPNYDRTVYGIFGYTSYRDRTKFDYLDQYGYDYRLDYMPKAGRNYRLPQILFRQRFAFGSVNLSTAAQEQAIRNEAAARPDLSSLSVGSVSSGVLHWDLYNGPGQHWSTAGFGTNVTLNIEELFSLNPGFDPNNPIYEGQFPPVEVSAAAKGVRGTGGRGDTANQNFFAGEYGDIPFKFFLHEFKGPGTINTVDVPFSDNATGIPNVLPMSNSPNEGDSVTQSEYDPDRNIEGRFLYGTDQPASLAHTIFFDTFAPPPIFSTEAIPLRTDAVMRDKIQKNDANLRENFQNTSTNTDRSRRISEWMTFSSSNPQGYPYLETFVKMPGRLFSGFNGEIQITKEPVNLVTKGYLGQADNSPELSSTIAFQEDYITRFDSNIIFHGTHPSNRLRNINRSAFPDSNTQLIDKMEFDFILNPGTIRKKIFNRVQSFETSAINGIESSGSYATTSSGLPDQESFLGSQGSAESGSKRRYPHNFDNVSLLRSEGRIGSHYNDEDPLMPFYIRIIEGADAGSTVNQNGYYSYAGRFNGKPSWAHRRTDNPTGRDARANNRTPDNSNRDHYRIQYDSPSWILRDYSRNNTDLYTNAADPRATSNFTEIYRCENISVTNYPDLPIFDVNNNTNNNQILVTKGKPLTFSWDSTTHTSSSGTINSGEYTTSGGGATTVVYTITANSSSPNNITAITANVSSITAESDLYFVGEKITVNSGSFSGLVFYVHGVVEEDTNLYHRGWEAVLNEGDNPFGYDLYPDEFGAPASVLAPFMKQRNNIMSAESEYDPDTGNFKDQSATANGFFQLRIFQQKRTKGLLNFADMFANTNGDCRTLPHLSLFANVAEGTLDNITGEAGRTVNVPLVHVGDTSQVNTSVNSQFARNAGFRTRLISDTGIGNNGGEFLYDLRVKCRIDPREVLLSGGSVRTDVFLVMECSLLNKTTGEIIQTGGTDETATVENLIYNTTQTQYFYPEREFYAGRLILGGGINPFPGNNFGGSNPAYFKQIKVLKNDEVIHQYDGTAEEARDLRRLVLSNNEAEINEFTNNIIGITAVGGIRDRVGETIDYTIESVSGNVTVDDFVGLASFNGVFTLNNNKTDTLVLRTRDDFITEGDEQFKITILGGADQFSEEISRTITIKDTSKNPEFKLTSEPDHLLFTTDEEKQTESVLLRNFGSNPTTVPVNAYTNPYGNANIPTPMANGSDVNDTYRQTNDRVYTSDSNRFEIIKPSSDRAQYIDKLVLKNWGLPKINLSNLSDYIQYTAWQLGYDERTVPDNSRMRYGAHYITSQNQYGKLIFGANQASNISRTPSGFDLPVVNIVAKAGTNLSEPQVEGASFEVVDLSALYRSNWRVDRSTTAANVIYTGTGLSEALLDTGRTYYRVAEEVFRGFPTKTEILQYWNALGLSSGLTKSHSITYFNYDELNRHSLVQYFQNTIWQIEIENDPSKGDTGPRWVINAYEHAPSDVTAGVAADRSFDINTSTPYGREAFAGGAAYSSNSIGAAQLENWQRFTLESGSHGFDVNYNRVKYRLYQDSQTESVVNRTTPQNVGWEFVYSADPTSNPFYTTEAPNMNSVPAEDDIWDINDDTLSQIGTIEVVPYDLTYNRDRWTIRERGFPYDAYYEDENNPSTTNIINNIGFNLSNNDQKEYSVTARFIPYPLVEETEGSESDPFSRFYSGYPENFNPFMTSMSLETQYYPTYELAALLYDHIRGMDVQAGRPPNVFYRDSFQLVERVIGESRNPIGSITKVDIVTRTQLVGIHESPQDSPDSPNDLPRNTFKIKLRTKHVPDGTRIPFRILGLSDTSPPVLGGADITNLDFNIDTAGTQIIGSSQVLLRGFGDAEPFNSSPNHGLGDSPVINPNGLYTLLSNNPIRYTKTDSYRNITVNGIPLKGPRGFTGRVSNIPNNAEVKYTEWTFRQENSNSPRHLVIGETYTKNIAARENREDPSRVIRRIVAFPGNAYIRRAPFVDLYVGDNTRNQSFLTNEDREKYLNYAALNSPSWLLSQSPESLVKAAVIDTSTPAPPFLSSGQKITRRDANIFRFEGQVQETVTSKRAFSDRTIVQWEQREVVSTESYEETYTKRYFTFFKKTKSRTVYVPKEIRVRLFHSGNTGLKNLQVGDNVRFYYYDKINSINEARSAPQRGAAYGTKLEIDPVNGNYINITNPTNFFDETRWYGLGGNALRDGGSGLHLDEAADEYEVTNVSSAGNWFEVIINVWDTSLNRLTINQVSIQPHVGFFAYTSTETQPETVIKQGFRQYKVTAEDPREIALLKLSVNKPEEWPNLIAPAGFDLTRFNDDQTYTGFENGQYIILNDNESRTGTWSDGSARLITFEDIIDDNTPDSAKIYYKTSDSPVFSSLSDASFEVVNANSSPAGIAITRPLTEQEFIGAGKGVSGTFTIVEDSPGVDSDRNGGAELDFTVRDDNNIIEGDEIMQFELPNQDCNVIRFKLINNPELNIPEVARRVNLDMVFTGDTIDIEESYNEETLAEGISFKVINATLISSDSANGAPLNSPAGIYSPGVQVFIQSNEEDNVNPFTFRIAGSYGLEVFPQVTYRAREFESIEETRLKFKNGTKFNNGDIAYRKNPIQQDSPAFLTNLYGRADSPNFVLSQDVLANKKYNSPSPIRIASRVVSDSSPVVFDSPGESYKVDDIITEIEGFGWPPDVEFPINALYRFKSDPQDIREFKYQVVWQLEKEDLTVNPPIFEIVLDKVEYVLPVGNATETELSKSLAAYLGGQ